MTHKENLEAVRRACIKANPEIVEPKFGCCLALKGDAWWENGVMIRGQKIFNVTTGKIESRTSNWEILGRPIRLADVVLVYSDVEEQKDEDVIDLVLSISRHGWNLRKDSLEDQSEETVAFLAGLLL